MSVKVNFIADTGNVTSSVNTMNRQINQLGVSATKVGTNMDRGIGNLKVDKSVRGVSQLDRSIQNLDRNVEKTTRGMKNLAISAAAIGTISIGTIGFLKAGDAIANMENRLGLFVKNAGEVQSIKNDLFEIANSSYTGIEGATAMFSRMKMSGLSAIKTNQELLNITEAVAIAGGLSGGDKSSVDAAIVQLGQAFSNNFSAAAQEINSINEGAPMIAKAIADGLGVSVDQIKKMAADGELSAELVANALASQLPNLRKQVQEMNITFSKGAGILTQNFVRLLGEADKALNFSRSLGSFLKNIGLDLGQYAKVVGKDITRLKETIQNIISIATGFGVSAANKFIMPIVNSITEFGTVAIDTLSRLWEVISQPVGTVKVGVMSLFQTLSSDMDLSDAREVFKQEFKKIKEIAVEAFNDIKRTFTDFSFDEIMNAARDLKQKVVDTFTGMVDGIRDATGGLVSKVTAPFMKFYNFVVGLFKNLYMVIVGNSIYPDMLNAIGEVTKDLWNKVAGGLMDFAGNFIEFFSDLKSLVVQFFDGESFTVLVAQATLFGEKWEKTLKSIIAFSGGALIAGAFTMNPVVRVVSGLATVVAVNKDKIISSFESLYEGVKNTFNRFMGIDNETQLEKVAKNIKSTVDNLEAPTLSSLFNFSKETVPQEVINSFNTMFDAIRQSAENVMAPLNNEQGGLIGWASAVQQRVALVIGSFGNLFLQFSLFKSDLKANGVEIRDSVYSVIEGFTAMSSSLDMLKTTEFLPWLQSLGKETMSLGEQMYKRYVEDYRNYRNMFNELTSNGVSTGDALVTVLTSALTELNESIGSDINKLIQLYNKWLVGFTEFKDKAINIVAGFARQFFGEFYKISGVDLWEVTKSNFIKFSENLKTLFYDLFMFIVGNSVYRDLIDGVVDLSNGLWESVAAGFTKFSRNVKNIFNDIKEVVISVFGSDSLSEFKDTLTSFATEYQRPLMALTAMLPILGAAKFFKLSALRTAISSSIALLGIYREEVVGAFQFIYDKVSDVAKAVFSRLRGVAETVGASFRDVYAAMASAFEAGSKTNVHQDGSLTDGLLFATREGLRTVYNELSEAGDFVATKTSTLMEDMRSKEAGEIDSFKQMIENIGKGVADAFKTLGGWLMVGFKATYQTLTNGVAGIFNFFASIGNFITGGLIQGYNENFSKVVFIVVTGIIAFMKESFRAVLFSNFKKKLIVALLPLLNSPNTMQLVTLWAQGFLSLTASGLNKTVGAGGSLKQFRPELMNELNQRIFTPPQEAETTLQLYLRTIDNFFNAIGLAISSAIANTFLYDQALQKAKEEISGSMSGLGRAVIDATMEMGGARVSAVEAQLKSFAEDYAKPIGQAVALIATLAIVSPFRNAVFFAFRNLFNPRGMKKILEDATKNNKVNFFALGGLNLLAGFLVFDGLGDQVVELFERAFMSEDVDIDPSSFAGTAIKFGGALGAMLASNLVFSAAAQTMNSKKSSGSAKLIAGMIRGTLAGGLTYYFADSDFGRVLISRLADNIGMSALYQGNEGLFAVGAGIAAALGAGMLRSAPLVTKLAVVMMTTALGGRLLEGEGAELFDSVTTEISTGISSAVLAAVSVAKFSSMQADFQTKLKKGLKAGLFVGIGGVIFSALDEAIRESGDGSEVVDFSGALSAAVNGAVIAGVSTGGNPYAAAGGAIIGGIGHALYNSPELKQTTQDFMSYFNSELDKAGQNEAWTAHWTAELSLAIGSGLSDSFDMLVGLIRKLLGDPNAWSGLSSDNMYVRLAGWIDGLYMKLQILMRSMTNPFESEKSRVGWLEDLKAQMEEAIEVSSNPFDIAGWTAKIEQINSELDEFYSAARRANMSESEVTSSIVDQTFEDFGLEGLNEDLKAQKAYAAELRSELSNLETQQQTNTDYYRSQADELRIVNSEIAALTNKLIKLNAAARAGVSAPPIAPTNFEPARAFARGGDVWGAGTATSDSIPAMLSNGEFVVNAKMADKYRPLLRAINKGMVSGFANGGFVDFSPVGDSRLDLKTYGSASTAAKVTILDATFETRGYDYRYANPENPTVGLDTLTTIAKYSPFAAGALGRTTGDLYLDKSSTSETEKAEQAEAAKTLAVNKTTAAQKRASKAEKEREKTIKDMVENFNDRFKFDEEKMLRAGFDGAETIASSFKNNLVGLLTGELSFKDAMLGFFDTISMQIIDKFAESFTNAIFGENGLNLGNIFASSLSGVSELGNDAGIKLSKGFGDGVADAAANNVTPTLFGDGGAISGIFKGIGGFFKSIFSWIGAILGGGGAAPVAAATGGLIRGPGTGTSDSIAALLSNGEYVINAKATAKYGSLLDAINNDKLPAFAVGGQVGPRNRQAFRQMQQSRSEKTSQHFEINVTGDVSRQSRREIVTMLPEIANGVNQYNREKGQR